MRSITGLLLGLIIAASSLFPPAVQAQSDAAPAPAVQSLTKASPYEFAPASHMFTDKKTSGLGYLVDDLNDFLDNFRNTQGIMLFIAASGIALLALIYSMPQAALAAGAVASVVLLANKPILLVLILAPMLFFRHQRAKTNAIEAELVKSSGAASNRKLRQAVKKMNKANSKRNAMHAAARAKNEAAHQRG